MSSNDTATSTLDEATGASDGLMIEALGLSKYYGQFVAIEQVNFSVPSGQVAGTIDDLPSCKELIDRIVVEAEQKLAILSAAEAATQN